MYIYNLLYEMKMGARQTRSFTLLHNRMMYFIEEKNIMYKSQYGFRKNMSTSLAILELVENITTSIDDCKSTVGIFIDLKKAFDTVDHDILIKN